MAVSLGETGITYNDGSVQTTKLDGATDTGQLLSISSYTTAGSFTWWKPPGCTTIIVRLVGGGGGASGYCESGGGGGFVERRIEVRDVTSVAVTVGAGGAASTYVGVTGGLSGNGGTTSFGSYATATGGFGSNRNFNHTGGFGGTPSGGDINLYGGGGSGHTNLGGNGAMAVGGQSYFGGSAGFQRETNNAKAGNGAPGAGGPGARTDDGTLGGTGESGAVIIWEYK
jgi:hypothetical protein